MVKWWKPIILTFILGSVGGFFGYGITNKPIIDYYIESPPSTVDFVIRPLIIHLKIRNTGNTYAPLSLVVTVENAVISNITKAPHVEYSETQIKIHYRLSKNMDYFATDTVEFLLGNHPDNFTISYTVEKRFEPSPTGIISSVFGELNPYVPVVLTYIRTDTNRYELISA